MSKELDAAKELVKMLEEKEKQEKVLLSTLTEGDTFKIGEYDFIVLEQENGQTRVISKGIVAKNVVFDENTRDYNNSSLRSMIETEIQPMLESHIGAENMIEHEVDLTSVDMQNEFRRYKCKVCPITFDEVRKYNELLVNKDLTDWYWTCTPWSTEERGWSHSMAVVSPAGIILGSNCFSYRGVRPFCILKSNIFVSKGE